MWKRLTNVSVKPTLGMLLDEDAEQRPRQRDRFATCLDGRLKRDAFLDRRRRGRRGRWDG
jgi:hypothetical protein